MAEVFTADNSPLSVGASPPVMQGGYYPSIDRPIINGLGFTIPWGGASLQRIMSASGDISIQQGGGVNPIRIPLSMTAGDIINYNFEGLVGPQGPPGPPGPAGTGEGNGVVSGSRFRLFHGSVQSIPSGAFTILNWASKDFDPDNEFDLNTNRFQPSTAGYYQINVEGAITGLTTQELIVAIYKNETRISGTGRTAASSNLGLSVSTVIYLDGVADYVTGRISHNFGSNRNTTSGYNHMSGHRIS